MARKPAQVDPFDEAVERLFGGRLTITIEEAGQVLGLSRNSAYAAAARGEIPTLAYGRRRVVPVAALRRVLQLDPS